MCQKGHSEFYLRYNMRATQSSTSAYGKNSFTGSSGATSTLALKASLQPSAFSPTEESSSRVELFLPAAEVPRADGPTNLSNVDAFLPGTPNASAGGAMLSRQRGPTAGVPKRTKVDPWTGIVGMLNTGRRSGGREGVYVV